MTSVFLSCYTAAMATTHSITPDLDTRAGRMFAAGRVTVTFTSLTSGEHITITAKCRKPGENGGRWEACPLAEAKVIFFSVPNAGGGWDDKIGKFTYGKGFVADPNSDAARVFCAKQLVVFAEGRELPASLRAQEEDRCGKCGRALTDPVSIDPECYGQMTGSKHETKNDVQDLVDHDSVRFPDDSRVDAASEAMDTDPRYGTPEWDREQLAIEQAEYETELREGGYGS